MAKNISVDITQCSGYSSLTDGTHSLQIRTKYLTKVSPTSSSVNIVVEGNPQNYITFSALGTFKLRLNGTKQWDGIMYYSTNKTTWNVWNGSDINAVSQGGFPARYEIYLCGTNNTKVSSANGNLDIYSTQNKLRKVYVSGNIESLLDYRDVDAGNLPANISHSAFKCLFKNSNGLLSASSLVLPRTDLSVSSSIYANMFEGCTSLTFSPSNLPATTLSNGCYSNMFNGCTSLTNVSFTLPATTLALNCYELMFANSGLTTQIDLPATNLALYCYSGMFKNCVSLADANPRKTLPAGLLKNYCYKEMYAGCTSLTTAPNISASQINMTECCYGMFDGCSSLTTAPALAINTNSSYSSCAQYMFRNCTSLTTLPNISITNVGANCCLGMFENCTDLVNINSLTFNDGLLYNGCFKQMFKGCESITYAKPLPYTNIYPSCYQEMFMNCYSLAIAPSLPATTVGDSSYESMFENCSVLFTPPNLPADTLDECAYRKMFKNSGLRTIPELPVHHVPRQAYEEMFYGCSNIMLDIAETLFRGKEFIIPYENIGSVGTDALKDMFTGTSGTMNHTPTAFTTYYIPQKPFDYLTFTSISNFTMEKTNLSYGGMLLYSLDNGITWNEWVNNQITSTNNKILLAGRDNISSGVYSNNSLNGLIFYTQNNATVSCDGDIRSLSDYYELSKGTSISPYYPRLFLNCVELTTPPRLPSTSLRNTCYAFMFSGCSNLLLAPDLPSTNIWERSYYYMFENCTSLVCPPKLPANDVGNEGYRGMFFNCQSLDIMVDLPVSHFGNGCLKSMFEDCISLCINTSRVSASDTEFMIPSVATLYTGTSYTTDMFVGTAGTMNGTPSLRTTYYSENSFHSNTPKIISKRITSASDFLIRLSNYSGVQQTLEVYDSNGDIIASAMPNGGYYDINQNTSSAFNARVQEYLNGELEEDVIAGFYTEDGWNYVVLLERNA